MIQAGEEGLRFILFGAFMNRDHSGTPYSITYGENKMHQNVYHYKADQDPVHPFRQLSFGEFHGEENGDNCKESSLFI